MFYLPSALSNITTRSFVNDCCLLLSRTLPVSLCLSLKRTLVGGRRCRSHVAAVSGRRFQNNFGHLEFMYFWVQQPSELSVEERNLLSSANKFPSCWCCGISVHVPPSFCCGGPQLVHKTRELSTDQEESTDSLQTSGFTFGDNVTNFCDSFHSSCMLRTVEHLFLLVSSIFPWLREVF